MVPGTTIHNDDRMTPTAGSEMLCMKKSESELLWSSPRCYFCKFPSFFGIFAAPNSFLRSSKQKNRSSKNFWRSYFFAKMTLFKPKSQNISSQILAWFFDKFHFAFAPSRIQSRIQKWYQGTTIHNDDRMTPKTKSEMLCIKKSESELLWSSRRCYFWKFPSFFTIFAAPNSFLRSSKQKNRSSKNFWRSYFFAKMTFFKPKSQNISSQILAWFFDKFHFAFAPSRIQSRIQKWYQGTTIHNDDRMTPTAGSEMLCMKKSESELLWSSPRCYFWKFPSFFTDFCSSKLIFEELQTKKQELQKFLEELLFCENDLFQAKITKHLKPNFGLIFWQISFCFCTFQNPIQDPKMVPGDYHSQWWQDDTNSRIGNAMYEKVGIGATLELPPLLLLEISEFFCDFCSSKLIFEELQTKKQELQKFLEELLFCENDPFQAKITKHFKPNFGLIFWQISFCFCTFQNPIQDPKMVPGDYHSQWWQDDTNSRIGNAMYEKVGIGATLELPPLLLLKFLSFFAIFAAPNSFLRNSKQKSRSSKNFWRSYFFAKMTLFKPKSQIISSQILAWFFDKFHFAFAPSRIQSRIQKWYQGTTMHNDDRMTPKTKSEMLCMKKSESELLWSSPRCCFCKFPNFFTIFAAPNSFLRSSKQKNRSSKNFWRSYFFAKMTLFKPKSHSISSQILAWFFDKFNFAFAPSRIQSRIQKWYQGLPFTMMTGWHQQQDRECYVCKSRNRSYSGAPPVATFVNFRVFLGFLQLQTHFWGAPNKKTGAPKIFEGATFLRKWPFSSQNHKTFQAKFWLDFLTNFILLLHLPESNPGSKNGTIHNDDRMTPKTKSEMLCIKKSESELLWSSRRSYLWKFPSFFTIFAAPNSFLRSSKQKNRSSKNFWRSYFFAKMTLFKPKSQIISSQILAWFFDKFYFAFAPSRIQTRI